MKHPPFCRKVNIKFMCANVASIAAFFIFPLVSLAATVVPFTFINSDTTWDISGSPYVVESRVTVNTGKTLRIDPGVIVKFKPNASMRVLGKLIADGVSTDRISFTEYSDDSIGGDTNNNGTLTEPTISWDMVIQNGSVSFSHSLIKYSEGLFLNSGSLDFNDVHMSEGAVGVNSYRGPVTIKDSIFKSLESEVVSAVETQVNLKNIIVENHLGEDDVIVLYDNSQGIFDNVSITDVDFVVPIVSYDSTIFISNSLFSGGLESGMELYESSFRPGRPRIEISTSTINDFAESAIHMFSDSSVVVRGSLIENNGLGVELGDFNSANGITTLDISHSSIVNNIGYAIDNYGTASFVNAKNNWWGDPSGPFHEDNLNGLGEELSGPVDFIPWLTSDPFSTVKECCSSVAFIPGFQASRLYIKEDEKERKLWEPNENKDAEVLLMNESGVPLNPSVYTKDVIDEAYEFNIYKKFGEFMDDLVSEDVIVEWKKLPYDWRKSIPSVVSDQVQLSNNATYKIIDEIITLAENSDTGKVTLIAHSNGGLVSKEIIRELEKRGKESLIDKLILVAVPQLGTPKAIAGLLHGDKQDVGFGLLLDKITARQLGENMPGAYSLLPSEKYFSEVIDPVIVFDESIQNVLGFNSYGSGITEYESLVSFLTSGRVKPATSNIKDPNVLNTALLTDADNTHEDLDNWVAPENIKVVQIAGWGLDTIKGIEYSAEFVCVNPETAFCTEFKTVIDRKPLFTRDGDETVVIPSATFGQSNNFFIDLFKHNKLIELNKDRRHADILESSSLMSVLEKLIKEEVVSDIKYVSTTKPLTEGNKRLRLSVHSPVSLDVYDTPGNHTGIVPDLTTDLIHIEEEIPNSYYLEFGEGKYVGFDADEIHTIKLQGTGFGTFTLNTEFVQGDVVTERKSFKDVLVTPLMVGELTLGSTTSDVILNIDANGDGVQDFSIVPGEEFDPVLYLYMMKITISSLSLEKKIENDLIKKIDKIIERIEKGEIVRVGDKVKKYLKQIDRKRVKKIDEVDRQILINMFNNLLSNLN